MTEEVEWFVGIDWASQSHQVCLVDVDPCLRHGDKPAGRLASASRQDTLRHRDTRSLAPAHPPHPSAMAGDAHYHPW